MSKRAIDQFHFPAAPTSQPQLQTPLEQDSATKSQQAAPDLTTGQLSLSTAKGDELETPYVEPVVESDSLSAGAIAAKAKVRLFIGKLKSTCRQVNYLEIASRATVQLTQGARALGMPLVWVGVAAFCVGTGYSAFVWLTSIPPTPNCDRLWFFSLATDRLFCAEQVARSKDEASLLAGLRLLKHWSAQDPLYKRVMHLRQEWSKALLAIAQQKALRHDVAGAIQLARHIQTNNPVYQDAQKVVLEWESSGTKIKVVEAAVATALKAKDWQNAEAQLQGLKGFSSAYGQQQYTRLQARVVSERVASNRLQQLRELVNAKLPEDVETLGRAINLALQISPHTDARIEAENDIPEWIRLLVEAASARLAEGDLAGAIAAVQWLPETIPLPSDVHDLFWLNRAQQLSASDPTTRSVNDLSKQWQWIATLASIRQIQPTSPFYSQVQIQISQLEQRWQDATQLQVASEIARLQQVVALQLAIHLAEEITPDRPQHSQAQTLIAVWRQDIQRVEDRPYLSTAERLATSGKIPDLHAAIAQASQIQLGRALRPDAQAAIFNWRQQIQTIEDQPLLTQARQLAKQNKLVAAIQIAEKILPGRALYNEAQAAIQTWVATIQVVEDRPILDRAIALADQGNLGAAIDVAAGIAPERALYNESQTAIARWSAQLATRRGRSTASRPDDSNRHYNEDLPVPYEDSPQYWRR